MSHNQTSSNPGLLPDGEVGCCEVYFVDSERVERVRSQLVPDHQLQLAAELFKVFAHPTRLKILRALAQEELCVCDLAQVLDLTVSATSHQLRTMRQMRLVRFRTEGKLAYYTVCDERVCELLRLGQAHCGDVGVPA